MRLSGKTAFVTGGSSGIGLATARMFAAHGVRVAVTGRNRANLDAAATLIGPGTLAIEADVTQDAALEQAAAEAAAALGGFDIVFANAGIGAMSPLGATTRAAFDAIVATNLTAVFFTVQACLPHLHDRASVILNGSVHATLGMPGWTAYAATKGAVRSMVRNLAAELAPRGVRVNQVTPGGTRTPIWDGLAPGGAAPAALEARIAGSVPLGRMNEADEVAAAALYLASDDAAIVTGIEIVVDGGVTGAPAGAPARQAA